MRQARPLPHGARGERHNGDSRWGELQAYTSKVSQGCSDFPWDKLWNQLLDSRPCPRCCNTDVVVALEVEPELRLHAKIRTKSKRRVRRDRPLPPDDGVDSRRRHMQIKGKLILADAQRLRNSASSISPGGCEGPFGGVGSGGVSGIML